MRNFYHLLSRVSHECAARVWRTRTLSRATGQSIMRESRVPLRCFGTSRLLSSADEDFSHSATDRKAGVDRVADELGLPANIEDLVEPTEYVEADFESVCEQLGLAEENVSDRQLLHLIMLERNHLHLSGEMCPMQVPVAQWKELMLIGTTSARRRYFAFLAQKYQRGAVDRIKRKAKQLLEQEQRRQLTDRLNQGALTYDLGANSMLLRIYLNTMFKWTERRLYQAMKFGPRLVFDMSYESDMSRRELRNMVNQMLTCFALNRASKNPFDLHLCSLQSDSASMELLRHRFQRLDSPSFPMHLHAHNYMQMFDPRRLVYLSPHTSNVLTHFNEDDIYIIGGYVDKSSSIPLSLARAKRDKIRVAKLPLSKYLRFDSSFNPSLTLIAVTQVLLSLADGESWQRALRHVPTRRQLLSPEDEQENESRPVSGRLSSSSTRDQRPATRRFQMTSGRSILRDEIN